MADSGAELQLVGGAQLLPARMLPQGHGADPRPPRPHGEGDVETEREFLKPVAPERFELAELSNPIVDSKSRIQIRTNRYSVPE